MSSQRACFLLLALGLSFGAATSIADKGSKTPEEQILAGQTKASYRDIFGGYEPGFVLEPYFQKKLGPPPAFAELKKEWDSKASARFSRLQTALRKQETMLRGEIEDAATLSGARNLLRINLLRLRTMTSDKSGSWLASEGEVWQRVLQNIPYEEATLKSLVVAAEMRTEIWKEMRQKLLSPDRKNLPWTQWLEHLDRIQLAWPVDRVLLSEAKKQLPPAAVVIADHIAGELQKNSHRSVADIRKQVRGGQMERLSVLDAVWGKDQISLMENEMDLVHELKLRVAREIFRVQKGQEPKSLQELVSAGLLPAGFSGGTQGKASGSGSICYRTGKPWQLTQLDDDQSL